MVDMTKYLKMLKITLKKIRTIVELKIEIKCVSEVSESMMIKGV